MGKQITRRLACFCLGMAITVTAFALPARAAELDPENFTRALASNAFAVLRDEDLNQTSRAHAFRRLLRRSFDLAAISQFVLGRYWLRANQAEREEFVQLFEDYLVASYGRRLGNYSRFGLRVTGQRAIGADGAIVHSRIDPHDGPIIKLAWRLKRHNEDWRVVDIMVEGVSLAMVQRSEFTSVIRSSGGRVSGLLAILRKKMQALALRQTSANISMK